MFSCLHDPDGKCPGSGNLVGRRHCKWLSLELRFIFYDLCVWLIVFNCLSSTNLFVTFLFKFFLYIYFLGGKRARDSVASSLHESNSSLRLFLTICFFLNVELFSLCDCVYLGRSLWMFLCCLCYLLSYRTGWRLPSTDNIILGWWHALVHGLSGLFLYCPHLCSRLQRARRAS